MSRIPSACAQARGVEVGLLSWLAGALGAAILAGQIGIHLQAQAGANTSLPVLDNAAVVGISMPICVLTRTLQNRLALLSTAAPRPAWPERLAWLTVLLATTGAVGLFGTTLVPDYQRVTMLIDCLLLLGLGVLAAVLFGAEFCWTLPMAAALACATPGLIPIQDNVLMNTDARPAAVWLAVGLGAVATISYVALDDYTIGYQRRLLGRLPAVTDD